MRTVHPSSRTYIEYESEHLRAIVGPFTSRFMADEWAHKQASSDSVTWQGAIVLSPEEAEARIRESRVRLRA